MTDLPGSKAWTTKKRIELKEEIRSCTDCALHKSCSGPVPFYGPLSPIMVLGEAPGRNEDAKGRPFVGPAGRLLWDALEKAGVARTEVFRANAVSCYPGRTPTDQEMYACRGNLYNQIKLCRPQIILALGLTVNRSLGREGPMGKIRGHWFETGLVHPLSIGVFPTYHPAAVLRQKTLTRRWHEDLRAFAKEADKLGV